MTSPHEGPQEAPIVPPPPGTIADVFREALPDVEFTATQGAGDVILIVAREDVPRVLQTAKDDPRLDLKYLRCLLGVDHMEGGLEVVYQLYSFTHKHGVTIKTRLPARRPARRLRGADLEGRRLARAGDGGDVRHRLRRAPEPGAAPAARRHDGPSSAAQGQSLRAGGGMAGLRLGPEAAKLGHIPAGYESVAGEGGEESGE